MVTKMLELYGYLFKSKNEAKKIPFVNSIRNQQKFTKSSQWKKSERRQ